jgi:hypothetical protein
VDVLQRISFCDCKIHGADIEQVDPVIPVRLLEHLRSSFRGTRCANTGRRMGSALIKVCSGATGLSFLLRHSSTKPAPCPHKCPPLARVCCHSCCHSCCRFCCRGAQWARSSSRHVLSISEHLKLLLSWTGSPSSTQDASTSPSTNHRSVTRAAVD